MRVFRKIEESRKSGRKQLAVLIDPDRTSALNLLLNAMKDASPDLVLIGGSFRGEENLGKTIEQIRKSSSAPIVIFPGNTSQINSAADAILLLSVTSSRNAELLIGKHVEAAMRLRESQLEIIPTGYILIEGTTLTTVQYMSQSLPVPRNKPGIACATALAGEQLGLRATYLEAGSGAKDSVPEEIIRSVRETISGVLICGGGITTGDQLERIFDCGADIAVVGTALENNPADLIKFIEVRNKINKQ
ncbi:MAG: geranylgeranylglyceryl/heptaprenylglyceryl phosphate synthase [Bacteroidia bacterium]|nr:geranylgeranylglyceryl/heptaprenylglyceryl phosphate synthase [Bacteroidia bacterium]